MKLCTCNNCGNVYEDENPSDESIEYLEDLRDLANIEPLSNLDEDEGFYVAETYWGCPVCKTDGYLVDNINDNAGGRAKEIIDNYTVI